MCLSGDIFMPNLKHLKVLYVDCFRHACSIELKEIVILTGGYSKVTHSKVTVYNNEGFVEDWPELNTGRYDHGCGHFVNTDNKVVRHIDDKKENTVLRNIVLTMEEGFAVNMRMRTVFHGKG